MDAKTAIKQIKVMLGIEDTVVTNDSEVVETETQVEETVVELASAELVDGTKVEAEAFEIGKQLLVVTEEGPVSAPEGVHETNDGMLLTVDAEGVITSVDKAEQPDEELVETKDEFSSEDFLNQVAELINNKFAELENRINKVDAEFSAYLEEPAAKKITNNLNETQKFEGDLAEARFQKLVEFRNQSKNLKIK